MEAAYNAHILSVVRPVQCVFCVLLLWSLLYNIVYGHVCNAILSTVRALSTSEIDSTLLTSSANDLMGV